MKPGWLKCAVLALALTVWPFTGPGLLLASPLLRAPAAVIDASADGMGGCESKKSGQAVVVCAHTCLATVPIPIFATGPAPRGERALRPGAALSGVKPAPPKPPPRLKAI